MKDLRNFEIGSFMTVCTPGTKFSTAVLNLVPVHTLSVHTAVYICTAVCTGVHTAVPNFPYQTYSGATAVLNLVLDLVLKDLTRYSTLHSMWFRIILSI
jgi:hypothetical protein